MNLPKYVMRLDFKTYTTYTSGGTAHNMSYLRLISADGYSGVHDNLGGLGKTSDYTIERGYFLCDNDDPLKIRYVSYEADVTKWDSMFKEAIAARIAADITTELDQDQSDKNTLVQEYMQIIKHAKMADAIETPAEVMPESDWLASRL